MSLFGGVGAQNDDHPPVLVMFKGDIHCKPCEIFE